MAEDGKTEEATPKKKRDARAQGNVFQSRDLSSSLGLIIMVIFIILYAPVLYNLVENAMKSYLGSLGAVSDLTIDSVMLIAKDAAVRFFMMAMPFLLVVSLFAVVFTGAQTRFLFTMNALSPSFDKLNPIKGIGNLISLQSIVELIKSLLKVIIIGWVIYKEISEQMPYIMELMMVDLSDALIWCGQTFVSILFQVAIILIVVGGFDYAYQRWKYSEDLKMSKEDVKQEHKNQEGSPETKGRIKSQQMKMAHSRMMAAVPGADVIVRNPTHFAVAIKYDRDSKKAPIVIAKGKGFVALRIIEVGEENNISIIENKPLARGLFDAVDVDKEIPQQFFKPVAELLAYIYRMKHGIPKGRGKR